MAGCNEGFCNAVLLLHRAKSESSSLDIAPLGPYEESTRLMPTLIRYGLKGELPPLVNPDVAHDYVYVEDVVDAYLLAATKPSQERTGIQTSLRKVVDVARQVMGIAVEPKWGSMPNRNWDTSVWIADNRKIRETLGWHPRYSFEEGFRLTEEWFRQDVI